MAGTGRRKIREQEVQIGNSVESELRGLSGHAPKIDWSRAKKLLIGSVLFLCSSLHAQVPGNPLNTTVPAVQITVPLTALDDQGNPILDLSKEQLTILDNGRIVEGAELRKTTDLPLDLGIVLRASAGNFTQQQAAAVELLRHSLHADKDRSFVITAGGNQPWPTTTLRWQSDPNALAKSIQGFDKCTGFWDPFLIKFDSSTTCWGNKSRVDVPDGVFGVLWEMFKSDPRPARRVVVLFREPWGHIPLGLADADASRETRLVRVISMAQQLGVLLYVIGAEDSSAGPAGFQYGLRGPTTFVTSANERLTANYEKQYAAGRSNIDRMAEETGGRAWWSTKKNCPDAVAGIVKALNGEYALTFHVSGSNAAHEAHRLKVTVKRTNAHVFAPSGYFMPAQ